MEYRISPTDGCGGTEFLRDFQRFSLQLLKLECFYEVSVKFSGCENSGLSPDTNSVRTLNGKLLKL